MNEEKTDEALKADESQIEVESPATEVLPAESQTEEEASESTEEETPEAEVSDTGRKTASSRIQELVAQKKEAQKEAEEARTQASSLAEQVRQFTAPQVPNYAPSQESAESGEVTVQEVLRQADALTQIRLAQQDNLHRVNNEANEAIKEYPELDPKSDSFDPELSESISRATLAQITVNPTASVKGFVSSLMKPYRRSLEKQVAGAYDARNNVEMAFDIFKNELDGRRGRTGDPVRARGCLLIKFLALMIRVRMQIAVSRSKVKNLTVENALMSAATYEIVKDRGVNVRSEKTKRVREIFEAFGVEDPEHLELAPQNS